MLKIYATKKFNQINLNTLSKYTRKTENLLKLLLDFKNNLTAIKFGSKYSYYRNLLIYFDNSTTAGLFNVL